MSMACECHSKKHVFKILIIKKKKKRYRQECISIPRCQTQYGGRLD